MRKIASDVLLACDQSTCCMNELIVLPTVGDVGFEEYFNYKADEIQKAKHLFSKREQNRLILCYPKPSSKTEDTSRWFPRFFESPSIVARNQDFDGCFGIDITAYINNTSNEEFDQLLLYMRSHPQVTDVLFVFADNVDDVKSTYNILNQFIDVRLVSFPLPNPAHLSLFTCDLIRDFCLSIDHPISQYLEEYYTNHRVGYDAAEFIARYLKNNGFDGSLDSLKKALDSVNEAIDYGLHGVGFGF